MILKQDFPTIKQGGDFSAFLPISSNTVDLTDCEFYCEIRRYSGAPLLAKVNVSYSGTSSTGQLNFSIPHASTDRLPETSGNALWRYDLFVKNPDGTLMCLAEGKVSVNPKITDVP